MTAGIAIRHCRIKTDPVADVCPDAAMPETGTGRLVSMVVIVVRSRAE
jgi:hypothetical protein